MFFDVPLDFVLYQIGGDRVKNRTKDKMPHSSRTRGVDRGKAHLPLLRMKGGPDVVDRVRSTHRLRHNIGLSDVADDDIIYPALAQGSR